MDQQYTVEDDIRYTSVLTKYLLVNRKGTSEKQMQLSKTKKVVLML